MATEMISVGDLVRPRFTTSFNSGTASFYVLNVSDIGIVTQVIYKDLGKNFKRQEIECMFKNRFSWWMWDDIERVHRRR